MGQTKVIAIVDDDESVREGTADLIRAVGLVARVFPDPGRFLSSDALEDTACLISDLRMPGMSGLDLYRQLVTSGRDIPFILITAFPDERDRTRAMNLGVKCYLSKPFTADDLFACIRSALGRLPSDRHAH